MSELFPELDAYEQPEAEPDEERRWSANTRALFETLGGALPDADDHDAKVYEQHEARLSRPGLAAGAESLARFERALGLVGKLRSLKRTEGDAIEFVAELDEDGTLGCGLLTPPGERAWEQGKTFGIGYRGEQLHPQIAQALQRFMARYDGAPFELILGQIVPDPGDEHMIASDYPESVFYAFASSSAWRRFFEGTELYRGTSGNHRGNIAIIDHADIECLFSQPAHDERLPNFFNIPATELDAADDLQGDSLMLFTDIGDVDVIKGADVLVDEALQRIAELRDKPSSVVIQAGCLPEVTGDDIHASSARTHDRLRLPVIAVGQHNDVVGATLDDLLAQREVNLERALESHAVMLLGTPQFGGLAELQAVLARAGIEVLGSILPRLHERDVDGLLRASVLVAYPWDRYEVTIRRLAARMLPARTIWPRSPFGFDGTRRWLLSVGAAVGRRDEVAAAIEEHSAPLRERWQLLQRRARARRVGFVIDHGNWRSALSVRRCLGVPMLELLCEMGFGVEILAYAGASPADLPAEQRFDDIRIRGYQSVAELDDLLADEGVAAWYSEMHYDRRLTRNGKNSFSMRQFSMGFGGALDGLEALLRVCNMSFYRSYGRYLGPAFLERTGER